MAQLSSLADTPLIDSRPRVCGAVHVSRDKRTWRCKLPRSHRGACSKTPANTTSSATSQLCDWCEEPHKPSRPGHRFCSQRCRQAAQRFRVDAAGATASTRPMRFGYADPPYPGTARRYYHCTEVDHAALVVRLIREYPDGWALSTSAKALPYVLSLIPLTLDPRVCIWDRKKSRGRALRSRNRWEPLIVVGGRVRRDDSGVEDLLEWGGRQHSHPGALVGMKPAAFCEWMFRQLGAARGDTLDDLFGGSRAVARAWRLYTRDTSLDDPRKRVASRLAGVARRQVRR